MTFNEFCDHVRTGGMRYGGSCISWGRSAKRNAAVDGHADSFHLTWLAADVVFDDEAGKEGCWKFWNRNGLSVKENGDLTLHVQALKPVAQ